MWARVVLHLAVAAVPLLAIAVHVFGWLSMPTSTAVVLVPLLGAAGLVMLFAPHRSDRVVLAGMGWGLIACGFYDLFRWDTVYLGFWGDFIPRMGAWLTGDPGGWDSVAAGYIWRYLGDACGAGGAFFLAAAALGGQHRRPRRVVAAAVGYAVFPVWAGLVATVAVAPRGQAMMFPLTTTTVTLSLIGHLIFGLVLGLGFVRTERVRQGWPWAPVRLPFRAWRSATPAPGATGPSPPAGDRGPARGRGVRSGPVRVLVVGGGAAGLGVARRLERHRRRGAPVRVTLIDRDPHSTYQPLLPDVAAGTVEPRHVLIALRRALSTTRVLTGTVLEVDDPHHRVRVELADGTRRRVRYDLLVLAPGSATRAGPVTGLEDHAWSFRTVQDAVGLRDHVLRRLEQAAVADPVRRAGLVTFVVVGGGYAGVEACAELAELTAHAHAQHREGLTQPRWILVHSGPRLLPELPAELGERTARELATRGVQLRLQVHVSAVDAKSVTLDDGTVLDAHTVVWAAGTEPHPLLAASGLPRAASGRLAVAPTLQVQGHLHVFAAGDAAAVPDLLDADRDAVTAPTAQHAVRQAPVLADNIAALIAGTRLRSYAHRHAGSMVTLGRRRGVADVHGHPLTGRSAWALHHAYHLLALPSVERRVRVVADWALTAVLGRDIAALNPPHGGRASGPRPGPAPTAPARTPATSSRARPSAPDRTRPRGTLTRRRDVAAAGSTPGRPPSVVAPHTVAAPRTLAAPSFTANPGAGTRPDDPGGTPRPRPRSLSRAGPPAPRRLHPSALPRGDRRGAAEDGSSSASVEG